MNKVYKVIWSQVKGCFVVVPECANKHGKARTTKAKMERITSVTALAAALLTGIVGIANVQADTSWGHEIRNYWGNITTTPRQSGWDDLGGGKYNYYYNVNLSTRPNDGDAAHLKDLILKPNDTDLQENYMPTRAKFLVDVGYLAYYTKDGLGTWDSDTFNLKGLYANREAANNGQGVSVGPQTVSSAQATALGNDVYALGRSSIAIGTDDIMSYRDEISEYDNKHYFGPLYESIDKKGEKYGYGTNENGVVAWDPNSGIKYKDLLRKFSPTLAQGDGAIAIGARSLANDTGTTAVGTLAFALKKGATALGTQTRSEGEGSIAIGNHTMVFSDNSVGAGNEIQIIDKGGMAYGYRSYAGGTNSIAIGSKVYANTKMNLGIKYTKDGKEYPVFSKENNKLGLLYYDMDGAVKGAGQNAAAENGEYFRNAGKTYIEALEDVVTNDAIYSPEFADIKAAKDIPNVVQGHGKNALVIGSYSMALGDNGIALGHGSYALGTNNFAIGSFSFAEKPNAMAIGLAARALGENSIALGVGTSTEDTATNSLTIGYRAKVHSATGANQTGVSAMAIGTNSEATLNNSIALGTNSKTDYTAEDLQALPWVMNDAIGVPTTAQTGVVSVGSQGGERRIVNVASGFRPTDAVNVAQLTMVADQLLADIETMGGGGAGGSYRSIEREKGLSGTLRSAVQTGEAYKQYVALKSSYLSYLAREKYNGETFNPKALETISNKLKEMEQANGTFKTKAAKLNEIAIDNPSVTELNQAMYDDKMKAIHEALEGDRKVSVTNLSEAEISKKKQDANYDSKGAAGADSLAFAYGAHTGEQAEKAVAIGVNSQADGAESIVIGSGVTSDAAARGGVAIGKDARVMTEHSVALGEGSVAVMNGNPEAGWAFDSSDGTFIGAVRTPNFGVVSVGRDKDGVQEQLTRRITNVAAGAKDTDAVNVGQIKGLKSITERLISQLSSGGDNTGGNNTENKVYQLYNGTAGNMVYTTMDGSLVLNYGNQFYSNSAIVGKAYYKGKWYNAADMENGKPKATAQEQSVEAIPDTTPVVISAVGREGDTTTPIVIGNVKSALDVDRSTGSTGISSRGAKGIIGSVLNKYGADLQKVATLGDMQALAQGGLDFTTNEEANTVQTAIHRVLGSTLRIEGNAKAAFKEKFNVKDFSGDNIYTSVDGKDGIKINMAKSPIFKSIRLGDSITDEKLMEITIDGDHLVVKKGDTVTNNILMAKPGETVPPGGKGDDTVNKDRVETLVTEKVNTVVNDKVEQLVNNKVETIVKDKVEHIVDGKMARMDEKINQVSAQANAGTAAAMASSSIMQVVNARRSNVLGVGFGTYHGEQAVALGFVGTNKYRDMTYKVATTVDSTGTYGFSVGLGFAVGPSTEPTKSVETTGHSVSVEAFQQLMATVQAQSEEIKSLKKEIQALQAKQG